MPAFVHESFDDTPEQWDTPVAGADAVALPTPLLEAFIAVDVEEQFLVEKYPEILKVLLADRTTGKNIIWATDHYADFGPGHQASDEVTPHAITGGHGRVIQPRIHKAQELRSDRTRGRGEVFTPSWLCNEQNNLCDDAWFGRSGVFNEPTGRSWEVNTQPIRFDRDGDRTWHAYVDERRLEAACGEAPYLVSRYDSTTGGPIDLNRRIGLLDRKLRVVAENATNPAEWFEWARRAFESIYAFEFQGDNLLLARENLLAAYVESRVSALGSMPSLAELLRIGEIISWNIWQMDAMTFHPPFQIPPTNDIQLGLLDEPTLVTHPCIVRDWRQVRIHRYQDLANPRPNNRG